MTEPNPPSEMSYEEAFAELEEIVGALESEESELQESLSLFERGQALAAHCSDLLDSAELKLKELDPEGDPSNADASGEDD